MSKIIDANDLYEMIDDVIKILDDAEGIAFDREMDAIIDIDDLSKTLATLRYCKWYVRAH